MSGTLLHDLDPSFDQYRIQRHPDKLRYQYRNKLAVCLGCTPQHPYGADVVGAPHGSQRYLLLVDPEIEEKHSMVGARCIHCGRAYRIAARTYDDGTPPVWIVDYLWAIRRPVEVPDSPEVVRRVVATKAPTTFK